jgi:nicotinic acid mononucleotide adenylyltransferase
MKKDVAQKIEAQLNRALTQQEFLTAVSGSIPNIRRLWRTVDWEIMLETLFPLSQRLSCRQVLDFCRPLLEKIAPEPEEGWLSFSYRTAAALLFPTEDGGCTAAQQSAAICYLRILQVLLDEERQELPFDPRFDFDFCTEEELSVSFVAEEYRRFLARFRAEYVYEMMRIGREATPFRTLDHIAGVHHVAMTVARAFSAGGGLVDLALMSGAAAGHDIGKFGCKPGERVPYLHYHYTDQWFTRRGMNAIGHIAANHSVWDLEIENLSSESLILVYSDFRVKQSRDSDGTEIAHIFSLKEAFDVILSKLDNVDAAKERRYRFVYAKLHDFEEYLISFGVDVSLSGHGVPAQAPDPALLPPEGVVAALRHTAVDHNIRLMHRLSHDELFASVLESARSEKDWGRLRAYVAVFEEYFTYLTSAQKEQTLDFLYELLVHPDGDIRRQAASLMGKILAGFHSGYKKERPAGAPPDPESGRHFALWADYLERLITPDRRLTSRQTSMIRYTAKTVVKSLLENCSDADAARFTGELFRHYDAPADTDPDTAFALLDTVVNVPAERCDDRALSALTEFAAYWLRAGELPHKAAALGLFSHLLSSAAGVAPYTGRITMEIRNMDCEDSAPVLFLQNRLLKSLGVPAGDEKRLLLPETVSGVFLDNLKSATHWILKAAGVEYLLAQVAQNAGGNVIHIAAHFSNLIKVSENVIVRRMAGASLLVLAPSLTPDGRNEIAVELSKALETGQAEISQYIPEYLGQFALWLKPRELDEVIDEMQRLLSSANTNVVAAALSTVGSMLEHYMSYAARFSERDSVFSARRRRLAGLLLKGLSSRRPAVRQEALRILGEGLFASPVLSYQEKTDLFTLMAKKILCLISEGNEQELTFFYTASALSHLYRFIIFHTIESGAFQFRIPEKVAFFPGTFDPFSLSHKGIVQDIRDRGFEVYLSIDEFSWSKKAQPGLIRRALVSMSVADEFDVYLFPHDIPVNLANPGDLTVLRKVFAGRELYLVVGSDVVSNASSYRLPPSAGSVHSMNHIVFRRQTDSDNDSRTDLSRIQGKVLELQLPTHLEDISSTRIRDNIDLGRDISNLIDPAVQDYIYRNSLYLREPQYKTLIRTEYLSVSLERTPSAALRRELTAALDKGRSDSPILDDRSALLVLRDEEADNRPLGCLVMRQVNSGELFAVLGDTAQADYIREHSAGRICLILGIFTSENGLRDAAQLLITDALSQSLNEDCCYAVYASSRADDETARLLRRQGFLPVPDSREDTLFLVDMRSPVALLQNIPTTLKEPFASIPAVQDAIRLAHQRMQAAMTGLYPGTLILSLNAEVIYHRLVKKIVEINGVPAEPTTPRQLGEKMCVPFGKILRGNTAPNTVTKTIHTDKVFAPDLQSFVIGAFPGYAPLSSQILTIKSFRRPVILVDDLLHSGNRIRALEPMFRQYDVPIDRVLVGLLSGRGRDLMAECGREADCVYFVPNLRSWFVESTMYPFIGGDAVRDADPSVPGLTPAINLILPYAFPRFYKECGREAVYEFSRVCVENSRNILLALESAYRARYSRGLTLSRLSEAVILPLSPDKGNSLRYDASLSASACLNDDLQSLIRMRELLE